MGTDILYDTEQQLYFTRGTTHVKPETVYVVLTIDGYVPYVDLVTADREKAIKHGEGSAICWGKENETRNEHGEIYFNQREGGNMESAVSVQECKLE